MVNIAIKEENGQQLVSARELHKFLEIETRFDIWIKRMLEYDFEQYRDYEEVVIKNDRNSKGGKSILIDYVITIDCAKEISMLQRSEKGKEARKYFIEVERKAKELYNATQSIAEYSSDPFIALRMKQIDQEKEIKALNEKVEEINIRTQTRPDYFTVVGYGSLNGISVNLSLASRIGRAASLRCKELGIETDTYPDPRFGVVKMYPSRILKEVFSSPLTVNK